MLLLTLALRRPSTQKLGKKEELTPIAVCFETPRSFASLKQLLF